ncbi:hypothetical protein Tsubulata_017433 [Turnera subulata]|uniref:DUF4283 domain-containing protein n=1 Tax=Turnera subulata TaxID=218843 RepID=A0A9Q0FVN8_9ROSI|nr:hypothetical protein Tsubulata_017433 [Turnera subulata]
MRGRERDRSRSRERDLAPLPTTDLRRARGSPMGGQEPEEEVPEETVTETNGERNTKKVRIKPLEVHNSTGITCAGQQTGTGGMTMEPGRAEMVTDPVMTQAPAPDLTKLPGATIGMDEGEQWQQPQVQDFQRTGPVQSATEGLIPESVERVVELSEAFKKRLDEQWQTAVVVKLLDRPIGYKARHSKLQLLWQPKGAFKILDLENNFYLVRFRDEEDYLHALVGGPWTIFGNVLSVQPWTKDFRATSGKIDKVMVWVQFPDFPVNRYHSKVFSLLGDLVGRTVKLDDNALNPKRAKFAKVSVCINLNVPLPGTVELEGEEIKVRYEGLPNICITCRRVGHNILGCPEVRIENGQNPALLTSEGLEAGQPGSINSGSRGEWMNVPRRTRRTTKRQVDGSPVPPSPSYFAALVDQASKKPKAQPKPNPQIRKQVPNRKNQPKANSQPPKRDPLKDISNEPPQDLPQARIGQAHHTHNPSDVVQTPIGPVPSPVPSPAIYPAVSNNFNHPAPPRPRRNQNHTTVVLTEDCHRMIFSPGASSSGMNIDRPPDNSHPR